MPSVYAHTNRLASEKSPYLLQHAHNPVDWYPWGEEAFEKARREEKFVFLSIGYATCHWCHVMERESFEDLEAAAVINTVAVPVKVDREERPDVDQVYMSVCTALHGHGGWPLTLLLTPEKVPFFAGTYFPRESRPGRLGLVDLLRQAGALWARDPAQVRASATDLLARLKDTTGGLPSGPLADDAFERAAQTFRQQFDAERGGFGGAPKFPTPHNLVLLLRRYRRTGDRQLLRMVETTLDAMARGGLHDHLGGGFHRYSTDARWRLPHFEKMLYDQAGLASAYLEAYQATGEQRWKEVAGSIFAYVFRDLRAPEGGFYCAEDADSEGVEGKFYVWSRAEVLECLGAADGERFCQVYGVRDEGNFRDEATREETGLNVLHLAEPGQVPDPGLEGARRALFARRERRVRPLRDEKILAGWNGLMIAALAHGARVLGETRYAAAASEAADFVLSALVREGRLLRRWSGGEAAIPAFAEDYAFLAHGLLELYAATFEPRRLRQALGLARDLADLFGDRNGGGLFDSASDAEALVLRPKEAQDGALPSANSAALDVFARLWLLTGDPAWEARARAVLDAFGATASAYPSAFTRFLSGAALLVEPTREVVLVGEAGAPDTRALVEAARSVYAPETAVLLADPAAREELRELAPFTAQMAPVGGTASAYVCEGFACRAPLADTAELRDLLEKPPAA